MAHPAIHFFIVITVAAQVTQGQQFKSGSTIRMAPCFQWIGNLQKTQKDCEDSGGQFTHIQDGTITCKYELRNKTVSECLNKGYFPSTSGPSQSGNNLLWPRQCMLNQIDNEKECKEWLGAWVTTAETSFYPQGPVTKVNSRCISDPIGVYDALKPQLDQKLQQMKQLQQATVYYQDTIQTLQKLNETQLLNITQLQTLIKDLRNQTISLTENISFLKDTIVSLNQNITSSNQMITSLNLNVTLLEKSIAELIALNDTQSQNIRMLKKEISSHIQCQQGAYLRAKVELFQAIAVARDGTDLLPGVYFSQTFREFLGRINPLIAAYQAARQKSTEAQRPLDLLLESDWGANESASLEEAINELNVIGYDLEYFSNKQSAAAGIVQLQDELQNLKATANQQYKRLIQASMIKRPTQFSILDFIEKQTRVDNAISYLMKSISKRYIFPGMDFAYLITNELQRLGNEKFQSDYELETIKRLEQASSTIDLFIQNITNLNQFNNKTLNSLNQTFQAINETLSELCDADKFNAQLVLPFHEKMLMLPDFQNSAFSTSLNDTFAIVNSTLTKKNQDISAISQVVKQFNTNVTTNFSPDSTFTQLNQTFVFVNQTIVAMNQTYYALKEKHDSMLEILGFTGLGQDTLSILREKVHKFQQQKDDAQKIMQMFNLTGNDNETFDFLKSLKQKKDQCDTYTQEFAKCEDSTKQTLNSIKEVMEIGKDVIDLENREVKEKWSEAENAGDYSLKAVGFLMYLMKSSKNNYDDQIKKNDIAIHNKVADWVSSQNEKEVYNDWKMSSTASASSAVDFLVKQMNKTSTRILQMNPTELFIRQSGFWEEYQGNDSIQSYQKLESGLLVELNKQIRQLQDLITPLEPNQNKTCSLNHNLSGTHEKGIAEYKIIVGAILHFKKAVLQELSDYDDMLSQFDQINQEANSSLVFAQNRDSLRHSKRKLNALEGGHYKIQLDFSQLDVGTPFGPHPPDFDDFKRAITIASQFMSKLITTKSVDATRFYLQPINQLRLQDDSKERVDIKVTIAFDKYLAQSGGRAESYPCNSNSQVGTTHGAIAFNSDLIKEIRSSHMTFQRFVKTALHEFIHLAGFDVQTFIKFEQQGLIEAEEIAISYSTKTSIQRYYLKSTNLLQIAKEYFGCPTLKGVPLEVVKINGIPGFNAHWDATFVGPELMAHSKPDYDKQILSQLTLAVLLDTKYYDKVDMAQAEDHHFGRRRGCDFVHKECLNNRRGMEEQCNPPENYHNTQCDFYQNTITQCTDLVSSAGDPHCGMWVLFTEELEKTDRCNSDGTNKRRCVNIEIHNANYYENDLPSEDPSIYCPQGLVAQCFDVESSGEQGWMWFVDKQFVAACSQSQPDTQETISLMKAGKYKDLVGSHIVGLATCPAKSKIQAGYLCKNHCSSNGICMNAVCRCLELPPQPINMEDCSFVRQH
ncbi:hypothetical protein ABPG72_011057 [Tetrahymena utriculariae]